MDSLNITLELNKQQKLINNITIMNVPKGDNLDGAFIYRISAKAKT